MDLDVTRAALDAALPHLPAGTRWLNVPALILVAATSGWLIATAGALAAATRPPPPPTAHWSARARATFPARIGARIGAFFGLVVGMVAAHAFAGPWSAMSGAALPAIGAAAGLLGGFVAADRADGQAGLPTGVGRRLRDLLVMLLFFFPHVVFASAMAFLAVGLGGTMRVVAPVVSTLALGTSGLWSIALLRALRLLVPAPAGLRQVVERMAQATATPLGGGVFVLSWTPANAFAIPLANRVIFTDRAVASFSDEDIEGICAHELAHLREPRKVLLVRVVASSVLAVPPILVPFTSGLVSLGLVLGSVIVFFAAQKWMQRYELLADVAAREHEPTPGAYGRALEKLHAINLMPTVTAKTTSHPNLYDRLVALGAHPEGPRPEPPSQDLMNRATMAVTLASAATFVGTMAAIAALCLASPARAVMVTGGGSTALREYTATRIDAEPEAAGVLLRACLAHDPEDERCQQGLARLAAKRGVAED